MGNKGAKAAPPPPAILRVTVGNTCEVPETTESTEGTEEKLRWTVFVRGAAGADGDAAASAEAADDRTEEQAQTLVFADVIQSVAFVLHKSFRCKVRHVAQPGADGEFALGPIVGRGEFEVRIRLIFNDKRRAPYVIRHMLSLSAGGSSKVVEVPVASLGAEAIDKELEDGLEESENEQEREYSPPWWKGMDEDAALLAFRKMHPETAFHSYSKTDAPALSRLSRRGHFQPNGTFAGGKTTILHHAARENWHRMIVQCIGHGMQVDTEVVWNWTSTIEMENDCVGRKSQSETISTPLLEAAKTGSMQALVRLVEYGADVSKREETCKVLRTYGMRNQMNRDKSSRGILSLAPAEAREQIQQIIASRASHT